MEGLFWFTCGLFIIGMVTIVFYSVFHTHQTSIARRQHKKGEKMNYTYLFEAHTIQRYIMESGKLREMIGASEILEGLTTDGGKLDQVLEKMGLTEGRDNDYEFSRRGGGAFYLLFHGNNARKLAEEFMNIWTFVVNHSAPGLEYNHSIGSGKNHEEAVRSGKDNLRALRNKPFPVLPEAAPLVRRNPRTGLPAVGSVLDPDNARVWVDAASKQKRLDCNEKGTLLKKKLLSGEQEKQYDFPRNLEHNDKQFPFKADNHTIGIIHADGNGLGQILMKMAETFQDSQDGYSTFFHDFSRSIDESTRHAACKALEPILKIADHEWLEKEKENTEDPVLLPMRPLILGGDDLTVIVRGDLALDYAHDFISAFEEQTRKRMERLAQKYPDVHADAIPSQLTACAGVAFLKSNQPFNLGYGLAESLCSEAKRAARTAVENNSDLLIPSALAFHRVTSSFIEEYDEALKRELTAIQPDAAYRLTLGAYGVGERASEYGGVLPPFRILKELKELFQEDIMSRGPTRQLLTLIHVSKDEAEEIWSRWLKGMRSDDNRKKLLDKYENLVDQLIPGLRKGSSIIPMPFFELKNSAEDNGLEFQTFIGDLISWMAAEGEKHAD